MTMRRLPRSLPVLETKRLLLRSVKLGDIADLTANYGDPEVMRYASDPAFTIDDEYLQTVASICTAAVPLSDPNYPSPNCSLKLASTGPAGINRRNLLSSEAGPGGVLRICHLPRAASTMVAATLSGAGALLISRTTAAADAVRSRS